MDPDEPPIVVHLGSAPPGERGGGLPGTGALGSEVLRTERLAVPQGGEPGDPERLLHLVEAPLEHLSDFGATFGCGHDLDSASMSRSIS